MSFNSTLAERFETLAKVMELQDENKFKVLAHAKASRVVGDSTVDFSTIAREKDAAKALTEIDGIGPKIADKIIEFAETGRIKELEERLGQVPSGLVKLLDISGMGPKTVRVLWQERGVTDLASLKKIIDDGSILTVPRMGAKTVENLKQSIAFQESSGGRLALGLALPIAQRIVAAMEKVKGVDRVAFAGSLRRGKETIGDIDILCALKDKADPEVVFAAFTKQPGVLQVLVSGGTKASVRMAVDTDLGRWADVEEPKPGTRGDTDTTEAVNSATAQGPSAQVDLRVVPTASWGAALAYFTGSKDHNVAMRERALSQELTLNEYGLYPNNDDPTPPHHRGLKPIAGATEESIYKALSLSYVPPELRESRDEFSWKQTPDIIDLKDIKAELHAHTIASDGLMTIEELARQAKARGFHTIAVTDHSKSQPIANGLSPDRLLEHIEAIHKAREKVKGIQILAGSEVDILADGTLDYDDALLKKLDIVVASPHNGLSQDPAAATKRLLKAIKHPLVHIIGHPTGRMINRRAGLEPNMSELIAAAIKHQTALEINAHWMRLDLRDAHVRAAVDAGCMIAIDCDVHAPEDFDNLQFGVLTARRGKLSKDLCVNAWPEKKLTDWLRSKRR